MSDNIKTKIILPSSINAAISRFDKAVRNHEMMGAQRPEDREIIEEEYNIAKLKLRSAIKDNM